ncbi:MAG: polysaccharide biosynthesis C-terminal domain-containing protein [Chloroflexi bacterium]|nr:polysaccharide biosynthesis C-terminal domain-containing protein [Chloroflexota bacterium]
MQSEAEFRSFRSAQDRGFLFNVNLVFLSQIAIYGLAFGLRVVLARGLGDAGLGTYSLFFLAVLVAGGVANLGVGLGNIYFLNKGTYSYTELLAGSLFVLAVTSALGWVLLIAYGLIAEPELFVSGSSFWLYAGALPAVVAYVLLTSFLHGASRFLALSIVAVSQGVAGLSMAGGLYLTDALDVFGALAAWVGSFALADLLALALVGVRNVDLGRLLRPRWGILREQVRYGAQGQIANLAQLFNYRLDQFLVVAFVSRAGLGHYSVAVGLGESVWWISSAVAMVLLPGLTQMDRQRAEEMTPLVCRNTLLVSIGAAAVLMAASPVLIRVLFGSQFDPATTPLLLLMPGVIAASATRVLGSYLFSQGRLIYNTYATFIALAVTISLDLVLIPWLEVPGAAIASSVAYGASLLATLYWYRRTSRRGIWEALVFRPSDRHFYADLIQRLRSRGVEPEEEAS